MDTVLAFLLTLNCIPTAWVLPSNATFFLDNVVYVRPDMMRAGVLVHELYHSCQYNKSGGGAKDWSEWRLREAEAVRAEMLFHDNYDEWRIKVRYSYETY